jgi:hypothetical protein
MVINFDFGLCTLFSFRCHPLLLSRQLYDTIVQCTGRLDFTTTTHNPTRQTVRKLMSIWFENLICNWYAVRSVYWSNSDQKCTFSMIKQNFLRINISQHFDMKIRFFLSQFDISFSNQKSKAALFFKKTLFK